MSQATIKAKTLAIPRDFGEVFQSSVTGDGQTMRFSLPWNNVALDSVIVLPTTVLAMPADYTLDAREGVIILTAPLATNAVMVIAGTSYRWFLPSDVDSYIDTAFALHTEGLVPAPTMDTLSVVEEYLVALLAFREFLWALIAEAANEVNVDTPEGMHIPEGQRFQQLLNLIERINGEYRDIAAQLNVGLYRIEMFTLRRVSRTTNRLVPVYVAQEFDDHSPPVRVYLPIDQGGGTSPPATGIDGGAP